ncbi:MAG TPA: hypothetical protein VK211_21065 [Kamptonema sp.]|nr:hypothetical protein [Kamptonema sp.]
MKKKNCRPTKKEASQAGKDLGNPRSSKAKKARASLILRSRQK